MVKTENALRHTPSLRLLSADSPPFRDKSRQHRRLILEVISFRHLRPVAFVFQGTNCLFKYSYFVREQAAFDHHRHDSIQLVSNLETDSLLSGDRIGPPSPKARGLGSRGSPCTSAKSIRKEANGSVRRPEKRQRHHHKK
jgi:hypothetical protein